MHTHTDMHTHIQVREDDLIIVDDEDSPINAQQKLEVLAILLSQWPCTKGTPRSRRKETQEKACPSHLPK